MQWCPLARPHPRSEGRRQAQLPHFRPSFLLTHPEHLGPCHPRELAGVLDSGPSLAMSWALGQQRANGRSLSVSPPLFQVDENKHFFKMGKHYLPKKSLGCFRHRWKNLAGAVATDLGVAVPSALGSSVGSESLDASSCQTWKQPPQAQTQGRPHTLNPCVRQAHRRRGATAAALVPRQWCWDASWTLRRLLFRATSVTRGPSPQVCMLQAQGAV